MKLETLRNFILRKSNKNMNIGEVISKTKSTIFCEEFSISYCCYWSKQMLGTDQITDFAPHVRNYFMSYHLIEAIYATLSRTYCMSRK